MKKPSLWFSLALLSLTLRIPCARQSSLLIINIKMELKQGNRLVLEVKHDIKGNYLPHFQPQLREL